MISTATPSELNPPASAAVSSKEHLAAEIERLEAEINQKRLEDEIKLMESSIAWQGNAQPQQLTQQTAAAPKIINDTQALINMKDMQQVKLEQEIQDMEKAIRVQMVRKTRKVKRKKKKKVTSTSSPQRSPRRGINRNASGMSAASMDNVSLASGMSFETTMSGASGALSIASTEKARIEEEIRQMEAEIAAAMEKKQARRKIQKKKAVIPPNIVVNTQTKNRTNHATETSSSILPPQLPSRNMLLSSITGAAQARNDRVEEAGGPAEPSTNRPPPLRMELSLGDQVMKAAREREARLQSGGEQKMRKVVIKEKDEYKMDFNDICAEAAEMGRLTRLNEHIVEGVAVEKTPEEEWKSKGLLAINWRSDYMSVIHQAANLGNETKEREHVAKNYDSEDDDLAFMVDPETKRLEQFLEVTATGTADQKVDVLLEGLREENADGQSLLVRPMVAYKDVTEVVLPAERTPKIDLEKHRERVNQMQEEAAKGLKPRLDIGADVAQRAWERRSRLNKPNSMPKVRGTCPCKYCGSASPYQTYAYRVAHQRERAEKLRLEEEHRQKMEARQRRMDTILARQAAARGEDFSDSEDEFSEGEYVAVAATTSAPRPVSQASNPPMKKPSFVDEPVPQDDDDSSDDFDESAYQQVTETPTHLHHAPTPTKHNEVAESAVQHSTVCPATKAADLGSHNKEPSVQQSAEAAKQGCACLIL